MKVMLKDQMHIQQFIDRLFIYGKQATYIIKSAVFLFKLGLILRKSRKQSHLSAFFVTF